MTFSDAETDCKSIIIIIILVTHLNPFKYEVMCGSSVASNRKISPHFIEVATLGFICSCLDFTKAVKITAIPDTVKYTIVASAVKSSFGIYIETLLPWAIPKT